MTTPNRKGRSRPGRPAGSPPNQEAILAAAREQFARRGYEQATIRGIASAAGVDPALVHHYFGSKDRLFAAAVELPFVPGEVVPELIAGDLEHLAERLVRAVLELWTSDAFVGLVRSAASHEEAARMFREFNARHFVGPIAEALPVHQPELRAALAGAQVVGLLMARLVVRLEPIASAEPETLVVCYAPAVQRCLTGPLALDLDGPHRPPDRGSKSW